MQTAYGTPGLAAVGYNGGETRATNFIAKSDGLARETVDYVKIITGLSAEYWRDTPPPAHDFRLSKNLAFQPACHLLAKQRRVTAAKGPEQSRDGAASSVRLWGVQLAYGGTRGAATRAYEKRKAQCPGPLRNERMDLIAQKKRGSGKSTYYMARIGRDTRTSADALCRKLAAAGCLCRVYRN